MAPDPENKVNEILVVSELPQSPVRAYEEDGKNYELVTFGEALKEILEKTRIIHERILKIA